jgi:Uma2 family endonuclease
MEYTETMALPVVVPTAAETEGRGSPPAERQYAYTDLLEWDEDVRAELHDGKVVMMPPPFRVHQGIMIELVLQLGNFLKGKKCKVYAAPFGVRLFPKKDRSDDTVFEPDIVVICDKEKLDERGCNGAPDLVIEITSPSTARYDRIYKLRKYEQAGVREYWIVDPETKSVQVFILETGRFVASGFDETEKATVSVLEGCEIDLQAVFAG